MSTAGYTFGGSERMLERAMQSIPLASQTFSKSKTQYPIGVSPLFMQRAEGAYSWDVDGNRYIDFVSALGAISLGYNDPDVMTAVRAQLEQGTIFSLPHPLEHILAELLIELIPCAEQVRFGKNGSDVTAAAVRIARAYTQREYVAVCGYHGWQDWYIGSTSRNSGVPTCVQALTKKFDYNDIASLERLFAEHAGQIACVIMEPMNLVYPVDGFLEAVRDLSHQNNALLIFDEMVTGFRYALGGAQEYFGVVPDLATFGKGMANGYPISAIVGKRQYMELLEEVFFSFTYGGETLSLAAALATLTKMQSQPVLSHIRELGTLILDGVTQLISDNDLSDVLSISGHPSWSIISIRDTASYDSATIKTLFLQEMFGRGILTLGSHEPTYAHTREHVTALLEAYSEVFPIIRDAVRHNTLSDMLRCEPLRPLFRVR